MLFNLILYIFFPFSLCKLVSIMGIIVFSTLLGLTENYDTHAADASMMKDEMPVLFDSDLKLE